MYIALKFTPYTFQVVPVCNSDDQYNGNESNKSSDAISAIESTTKNDNILESPGWKAFAVFKTILMIIGLVGNVLTFVTLQIESKGFKLVSRILLQLQAIADSFVCIMGIGMYDSHNLWMTTNHSFNFFLCHVWHNQYAFWTGNLSSTMQMQIMTLERFILIVHPMRHLRMSPRKCLYPTFVIIQILSIFFLFPTFFMVSYHEQNTTYLNIHYEQNTCNLTQHYTPKVKHYMIPYAIWWFFIGYVIPVAICIGLYTKIILTLKKRQEQMGGTNKILKIADKQMTKTAGAVATVFIISMSWDAWLFIIPSIEYEFHSPLQIIGMFFAALNSCANPFIYAAFLPAFRRSLKVTLKWIGKSTHGDKTYENITLDAHSRRTIDFTSMRTDEK